MENKIQNYTESIFESIKHIDEKGNEYWYARELQKVLEYKEWRKFKNVILKVMDACEGSKNKISDNFVGVDKIVKTGVASKTIKELERSSKKNFTIK